MSTKRLKIILVGNRTPFEVACGTLKGVRFRQGPLQQRVNNHRLNLYEFQKQRRGIRIKSGQGRKALVRKVQPPKSNEGRGRVIHLTGCASCSIAAANIH